MTSSQFCLEVSGSCSVLHGPCTVVHDPCGPSSECSSYCFLVLFLCVEFYWPDLMLLNLNCRLLVHWLCMELQYLPSSGSKPQLSCVGLNYLVACFVY